MALPRLLVWREEPLLAAGAVPASTTPPLAHAEELRGRAPRLQAGARPECGRTWRRKQSLAARGRPVLYRAAIRAPGMGR